MKRILLKAVLVLQIALIATFIYFNFGIRLARIDREAMDVDHLVLQIQSAGPLTFQAGQAKPDEVAYGRALYRFFKNIPDSILACLSSRMGDCGAGAFIEYVKLGKSAKITDVDFVDKLERELCLNADGDEIFKTARQRNNCYFYLGQSLLEFTSGKLDPALAFCETMKNSNMDAPLNCATGVYRRWFALFRHLHFAQERFDLLPCTPSSRYIYQCIKPKIAFAPKRWTEIASNYDSLCAEFGESSGLCHRAVGASLFIVRWKSDPMAGQTMCRKGSEKNQDECFKGAVDELITRQGTLSEALQLCDRLDSKDDRPKRCREMLSLGLGHSH